MKTTLFDIIDGWTLRWDRGLVEITLNDVSDVFYKLGKIFFLAENLWNLLEVADDPSEFMTDARAILLVEDLLRNEKASAAARALQIEVPDSPEEKMRVLNAEELIKEYPSWFEVYEGMTLSDAYSSLFDK